MMTFKDRATQIIELLPTASACIPLAIGLVAVKTTFVDRTGRTFRATHPVRPAQLADHGKAFCVVNQVLDVQHDRILPEIAKSFTSLESVKTLKEIDQ